MSKYVIGFDGSESESHDLVGGKGANLGRLTHAGFRVPPGFTVTTAAYRGFLAGSDLDGEIARLLGEVDYDDAAQVEAKTAELRSLIIASPLPQDVGDAVATAFRELGSDYVAVRSSGTAEDLAEASFAGLHDTFLDVHGIDDVLIALKRCWASLWTARATSYRSNQGFEHAEAGIAVVVQQMVESEVAGVMFTANPMNARTDEIVINASWGLGEGVVSGILTPDELIVSKRTLKVKRRTIGSKAVRVVRNRETGRGVVTEDVEPAQREATSLTDERIAELADEGRRITEYYHGLPQDIEWGLHDGTFYLLQSRSVTGVEFTWDEDLDASFQDDPEEDDETLWTNQWAREFWNGAITPLLYSFRGWEFEQSNVQFRKRMGFDDIAGTRLFKYRRGTTYFNTAVDALHYQYVLPRALRAGMVGNIHPDDQAAFLDAPLDMKRVIKALLRLELLEKQHGVYSWFSASYEYINNTKDDPRFLRVGRLDGLSKDELKRLTDAELKRHIDDTIAVALDFNAGMWDGFFNTAPFTMGALGWILANWYGDDADENLSLYQDLISGLPGKSKMALESAALWGLADQIAQSPSLRAAFDDNKGRAFFTAVADVQDGPAFLAGYQAFIAEHGHRGQADRDIYYDRRCENPGLDYEALRNILASDAGMSPHAVEQQQTAKRVAATDRVLARLRSGVFGDLKAMAFKAILGYIHRFLIFRDDERWAFDRLTLAKKRNFQEVGRRLQERGLLEGDKEFYFLSKQELFELLDGAASTPLTRAKVTARSNVFNRFLAREEIAPLYLKGTQPLPDVVAGDPANGLFLGSGTSRGQVTARARVVRNLEYIGRVEKGDILVCDSTDPGWASVFLIIKGLVMQTGGMLAHGACLSREYGLPAVTLENAMNHIPDGALVTISGETGEVRIEAQDADDAAEARPVAGTAA